VEIFFVQACRNIVIFILELADSWMLCGKKSDAPKIVLLKKIEGEK
jgi:hypothetical protein